MRYAPPLLEIDPVCATAIVLAAVAGLLLWWRQFTVMRRALAAARCQVCRLSASQHSLRDADRRRIARDLHDDLGQHLLAIGMAASALARLHPALRDPLARLEQDTQHATRSMRAIVHDLAPEALDSGLADAVQQQIADFSRLSGIACRLETEPATSVAPPGGAVDHLVYRVLQESLSNIVRHAQASEVCVGLRRQPDSLDLTVRDNGVGLAAGAQYGRRGHGLRGIAQRVAEAGGRLDIASMPGAGTALTMSFPIP